ncbi:hypothetical protein ACIPUB_19005 [Paeniglutamicibacter sp. ORCA_105]|jgi:alkylation response protein AidB-like acyl-CoA dehydrogenase|uniref:hypothetical protein n=1 Tax=Paeniglutamicibacter sp. ORCA_105 TaxID=3377336 RepID=UPI003893ADA2
MERRIFGEDHGHVREIATGHLDREREHRMPRSPWEVAGSPGAAPFPPKGHVDQRPGTASGGYGYIVETPVARAFLAAPLPTIVGNTSKNRPEGIGTSLLADA